MKTEAQRKAAPGERWGIITLRAGHLPKEDLGF